MLWGLPKALSQSVGKGLAWGGIIVSVFSGPVQAEQPSETPIAPPSLSEIAEAGAELKEKKDSIQEATEGQSNHLSSSGPPLYHLPIGLPHPWDINDDSRNWVGIPPDLGMAGGSADEPKGPDDTQPPPGTDQPDSAEDHTTSPPAGGVDEGAPVERDGIATTTGPEDEVADQDGSGAVLQDEQGARAEAKNIPPMEPGEISDEATAAHLFTDPGVGTFGENAVEVTPVEVSDELTRGESDEVPPVERPDEAAPMVRPDESTSVENGDQAPAFERPDETPPFERSGEAPLVERAHEVALGDASDVLAPVVDSVEGPPLETESDELPRVEDSDHGTPVEEWADVTPAEEAVDEPAIESAVNIGDITQVDDPAATPMEPAAELDVTGTEHVEESQPEAEPEVAVEPSLAPESAPLPESVPEPKVTPAPDSVPEASPDPESAPEPTPEPEVAAEPEPEPDVENDPEPEW